MMRWTRTSPWGVRTPLLVTLAALALCSCRQGDGEGSGSAAASRGAPSAPRGSTRPSASPAGAAVSAPALPQATALSAAQAQALLPRSSPPRVSLQEPGAAPRTRLRYPWAARAEAAVTVVVAVGTTVERGGTRQVQTPSELRVRLSLRAEPQADGAASLRVRVLAADAGERSEDAGGDPASQALASAESSLRLDARGIPLGDWTPLRTAAAEPLPSARASEALQIWATVRDALAGAFVPLPLEPVGQGARWRTLERSSRAGAVTLRESEHQLSLQDGVARIVTREREVAVSGPTRDPALPAEIAVEVLAGVGQGRRELSRRADDWLPARVQGELAADLDLELVGPSATPERSQVQLTLLWSAEPQAGAP